MSGWKQWFFSLLFGIAHIFCAGGLLVDYSYFKAIYGSDVTCPRTRIGLLKVKSRAICALICGGDNRCSGSNYLTASGQCQLLKYPCLPGSEKPRAGSIYIERLDNRMCQDQDVCYVYGRATWSEAFAICPLIHPNARMIQEHSDEEGEKHRQETLAAGFTRYFLGGRRPNNGNITEFYWQPSGVPISYSRWRLGQPYPGNDDCNCIMITMDINWLWEDNGCRTHAMYMCQIVYDA